MYGVLPGIQSLFQEANFVSIYIGLFIRLKVKPVKEETNTSIKYQTIWKLQDFYKCFEQGLEFFECLKPLSQLRYITAQNT